MWSRGNARATGPRVAATALALSMVASTAIAGSALAQDEKTLNVAIVSNGQMEDIASLTPELFTAETGINIEYTFLDEATLREVTTRDVAAEGEQFDVVMIGMFAYLFSTGLAIAHYEDIHACQACDIPKFIQQG